MFSKIRYLILCIFLLPAASFASVEECNRPLTLSSTSEWYPYIYQDQDGESQGSDILLLSEILSRMGCQLKVIHFPERRSLFELNQGQFDIGLGASKNKERLKEFYFSASYRNETNRLAYTATDMELSNAKNLNEILELNKVIGINLAGWYGLEIEKAKSEYNHFVYSETASKRLKMLNLKRLDIVIDDDVVLCSEIMRLNTNKLAIHPMILYQTPIHFIFNKKSISTQFISTFNSVINNMRESGELSAYYYKLVPEHCQPIER